MATKATRPPRTKGKLSGTGERYQKALESYERAIKTMSKGETAKAKEQFEKLKESFPEEKELLDRVRSYLIVCAQALESPFRPKSAEELVNYGIALLNDGDVPQAIKHLTKATELDPKSPHAHYCLAAAHAVDGDASRTAKHLKQAIGGDPAARIHARADEDFASVRNSAEVAALLASA